MYFYIVAIINVRIVHVINQQKQWIIAIVGASFFLGNINCKIPPKMEND